MLISCQAREEAISPDGSLYLSQNAGSPTIASASEGSQIGETPTATISFDILLSVIPPTEPSPLLDDLPTTSGPCTDGLAYMGDLTYPDRAKVLPGQPIDKQWKVRNSGSCDWGPDYRFRWISGTLVPQQKEYALFPAVAGSEAILAVSLTAPIKLGEYLAWWQAVSPAGNPFGDMLSILIIVAS